MKHKFQLGDRVQFSAHHDCIFIITKQHDDGSYTIETEKNAAQLVKYEDVVQEMLRIYITP